MSQGYAIELRFDPALTTHISKAYNILARASHNSAVTFNPYWPLFTAPPSADIPRLRNLIRSFAAAHPPLPVSFQFTPTGDADIGLLASPSLVQFHHRLGEAMQRQGIHLGGNFTPYYPAVRRAPAALMEEAFAALDLGGVRTLGGFGVEISLVQYSPSPQLCLSCPLGASISKL